MDVGTKAGRNGSASLRRQTPTVPPAGTDSRDQPEKHYQRLFETAHDGILVLDASSGRIVDANPGITRLLGLTPDAFLGKQLWEVGLLRGADSRAVAQEVSDRGVVRWEELLVESMAHPEGMDVEVVSCSYRQGDRELIQCHVRDITERKRADLSSALQMQKRSVADRHRNEFLAILSHELRNALAPVANALLILRLAQETDSPVPTKARNLIERQVGHLSHLVDDLQEISSIGTGGMRLQPGMVDLRLVVERSVEAVMSAHAHREHQVSLLLPAEPVWLDADAIRLEQVVVNLLSNAANYTEKGGSIAVQVSRTEERAELRVTDSGMGIAPEMLPRVFDLFSRTESARARSRNGMGIGLNIVKRIVELHGGSVVARSAGPGAGSEFSVALPLVLAPVKPVSIPGHPYER
jgi:PAS domain S-box-containing protein